MSAAERVVDELEGVPLPECTRWARLELDLMVSPEFTGCSAGARLVYAYLCAFINSDTRSWCVRVKLLAAYSGYSEAHVRRCLAELEGAQLIARRSTYWVSQDGKRQGANVYTLTDPPSLRERRGAAQLSLLDGGAGKLPQQAGNAPPVDGDASGVRGTVSPDTVDGGGPRKVATPPSQDCEGITAPPDSGQNDPPCSPPQGGDERQIRFVLDAYHRAGPDWWSVAAAEPGRVAPDVLEALQRARKRGGDTPCRRRTLAESIQEAARRHRPPDPAEQASTGGVVDDLERMLRRRTPPPPERPSTEETRAELETWMRTVRALAPTGHTSVLAARREPPEVRRHVALVLTRGRLLLRAAELADGLQAGDPDHEARRFLRRNVLP